MESNNESNKNIAIQNRAIDLLLSIHPWVKRFADAGALIFGGKVWRALDQSIKESMNDSSFGSDITDFDVDQSDTDIIMTSSDLDTAHKLLYDITDGNVCAAWCDDYGITMSAHFHASEKYCSDNIGVIDDFPDRIKEYLEYSPLFDISVVLGKNDTSKLNPRFSVENICFRKTEAGNYILEMLYPSESCSDIDTVIEHIRFRQLIAVEPKGGIQVYHANPVRFINRVLRKIDEGWVLSSDSETKRILSDRAKDACTSLSGPHIKHTVTDYDKFKHLVVDFLELTGNSVTNYFRDRTKTEYKMKGNMMTIDNARWMGQNKPELLMLLAHAPPPERSQYDRHPMNCNMNVALAEMARMDRESDFKRLLNGMDKATLLEDMKSNSGHYIESDYYTNYSTILEPIIVEMKMKYYDILVEHGIKYDFTEDDVKNAVRYNGIKALNYFVNKTCIGTNRFHYKALIGARETNKGEINNIDFPFLFRKIWSEHCVPETIMWLHERYGLKPWHVIHFAEKLGIDHIEWCLNLLDSVTLPTKTRSDVWCLTTKIVESGRLDLLIKYVDHLSKNHPNPGERIANLQLYGVGNRKKWVFYEYLLHNYYSMFHFLRYLVARFPDFIPSDYYNKKGDKYRRTWHVLPLVMLERVYYPKPLPSYVNKDQYQKYYDNTYELLKPDDETWKWSSRMDNSWYYAASMIGHKGLDITSMFLSNPTDPVKNNNHNNRNYYY